MSAASASKSSASSSSSCGAHDKAVDKLGLRCDRLQRAARERARCHSLDDRRGNHARLRFAPLSRRTVMPTYQYRCVKCGERFERYEPISEHGRAQPRCPKCASENTETQPPAFFAKTS